MEDYHTHFLGQVTDGRLFWGYETFVWDKPYPEIPKEDDWQKYRKEYVLVHTFDKDGNHLTTNHLCAGLTSDTNDQLIEERLEQMVMELGPIEYQDIAIKLFQIQIDGITFGLIADGSTGSINLKPGSMISFQEPWDGEYYT